jgi:hypothetical protein
MRRPPPRRRPATSAADGGPKDVSAQLKDTAQAEADQRQAAIEAELDGDQATAKALHSLAGLLGTQEPLWKQIMPGTRPGQPRRPGAAKMGRKPAPRSPPRPGRRSRT